ncbi:MAG: bifunctional diaminohydroxyphosphoribosylaminopyrimidine deaminase/5-amino-6-(5-phosphoribosylamino)uracil reductase RibD [Chitinophagaceae bacterium]|nr:bifunctional diaminohydroxyphosphoribosylaminopyrimidine deaminase/5-amino-6-(5-phosphoribosylamino)uracil reductase RibD [Chitinophagaceae bacterium]
MPNHQLYMQRCLDLAQRGAGRVAPNPLVGAVLVHEGRIIGEGWHQQYGGPHAEVHCVQSVLPQDQDFIKASTLYVSLEPCSHFGKTPPCVQLIIEQGIPHVVIAMRDPFAKVNGAGIRQLQEAGIEVTVGVMENEARALNKAFLTFHQQQRPLVTLKWAQTADGFIGKTDTRLLISNENSNRLVHQLRATHAAILIGTNTAITDNPSLTNRHWPGPSPVRLVLDLQDRLPKELSMFHDGLPLTIFSVQRSGTEGLVNYVQLDANAAIIPQILHWCYEHGLNSLLVEGGAQLLQSFIQSGKWDEAIVITNTQLRAEDGIVAPELAKAALVKEINYATDSIQYFRCL